MKYQPKEENNILISKNKKISFREKCLLQILFGIVFIVIPWSINYYYYSQLGERYELTQIYIALKAIMIIFNMLGGGLLLLGILRLWAFYDIRSFLWTSFIFSVILSLVICVWIPLNSILGTPGYNIGHSSHSVKGTGGIVMLFLWNYLSYLWLKKINHINSKKISQEVLNEEII